MSVEALRAALARWSASRTAAAAAEVDRLARALVRGRIDLSSQAAWHDAAEDVVTLTCATDALLENLPGDGSGPRSRALEERAATLAEQGADPRTGQALARVLATPPSWLDDAARLEIGSSLAYSIDDTTLPVFSQLRKLAPAAAWLQPPRELAAPDTQITELWRELVQTPDRDDPREVLADLLQTRGDPRGELIGLQLAVARDGGSRAMHDRIVELLRQHGRAWLGRLATFASRVEFRRGFPTVLRLGMDTAPGIVGEDPLLATVEELERGNAPAVGYAALAVHPGLVSLRAIDVFDSASWRALDVTPARLTRVAIGGSPTELARILARCERHPIRELEIYEYGLADVLAVDWLEELDRVIVTVVQASYDPFLHAKRLPEGVGLRVVWVDDSLEVTRRHGAITVRIAGNWLLRSLAETIAALPEVSRLILVSSDASLILRAQEAAGRRGCELVIEPDLRRTGVLQLRA